MSTDMVKRESQTAVSVPDEARIFEYLGMMGIASKLTEGEKQLFAQKCISENLNPFKNEIYPIVYGQGDRRKVSFISAFHTFIAKAERTGLLAGWKVWTEGHGNDLKAFIEIIRKDWDMPFRFDVDFDEFSSTQQLWVAKPKYMLKKCVIGTGFRLCFPGDMAGLYLEEEMSSVSAGGVVSGVSEPVQAQTAEPKKRRSRTDTLTEKISVNVTPTAEPDPPAPYEPEPVEDVRFPHSELLTEVLNKITSAETEDQYADAFAMAKKLTDEHELDVAREAYRLKKEAEQEMENEQGV